MAVIADRYPAVQVTVVDLNVERTAAQYDSNLSQMLI